jgi:hypothetical protein
MSDEVTVDTPNVESDAVVETSEEEPIQSTTPDSSKSVENQYESLMETMNYYEGSEIDSTEDAPLQEISNIQTTISPIRKFQIPKLQRAKTKKQIAFEYDNNVKNRQKEAQNERVLKREQTKSELKNDAGNVGAKKPKTIEEFLALPVLCGIEELIAHEAMQFSSPFGKRAKTISYQGMLSRANRNSFQHIPTISPSKAKIREEIRHKKEKLEQRKNLVQAMYEKAIERKSRPIDLSDENLTKPMDMPELPEIAPRDVSSFFMTATDHNDETTAAEETAAPSQSRKSRRRKEVRTSASNDTALTTETEPTPTISVDYGLVEESRTISRLETASKRSKRKRKKDSEALEELLQRSKSTSPPRMFRGDRGWDGSVHVRTYLSQTNSHDANDDFHDTLLRYQKVAENRGQKFTVNSNSVANYSQYIDNQKFRVRPSSKKSYHNYSPNDMSASLTSLAERLY